MGIFLLGVELTLTKNIASPHEARGVVIRLVSGVRQWERYGGLDGGFVGILWYVYG